MRFSTTDESNIKNANSLIDKTKSGIKKVFGNNNYNCTNCCGYSTSQQRRRILKGHSTNSGVFERLTIN